jgi:hypothetical protein
MGNEGGGGAFSAAAARQQAMETPRMALAPSLAVVRIEGTGSVDTFIWGSIEVNEEFVDGFLVFDIKSSLDQSRRNDIIDIGNSLGHT